MAKKHERVLWRLIMQCKSRHWKELYNDLHEDIWGWGYVKNIGNVTPFALSMNTKGVIIEALFPIIEIKIWEAE